MDVDLNLARIGEAARVVNPVFRNSPQFVSKQLSAVLGRNVLVKVETANPVGSFKGRGADFFVRSLPPGRTVVCASSGNFGQALAYTTRARGVGVHVYVSADLEAGLLARMQSFGAQVTMAEGDPARAARAHAAVHPGCVLANNQPAVAEGAGTIGVELLRAGQLDTVVLPVGDGALITGVGRRIKAHSPGTRMVGVCPAAAPAMARSWQAGRVVRADPGCTIAGGLAMREPAAAAVRRLRALVDDMLLVTDAALLDAMHLAARTLGLLARSSGRGGLAAIAAHDLPGRALGHRHHPRRSAIPVAGPCPAGPAGN